MLFASLLCGVHFIGVVNANPTSWILLYDKVVISIQSPQNRSYNVNTVAINFTYETNNNFWQNWWEGQVTCILNKEKPFKINATIIGSRTMTINTTVTSDGIKYTQWTAEGEAILSNLTDGTYFLVLQRPGNPLEPVVSANVSFTVDTVSPSIHVIQLENKTFYSNIPLNFTVNEPSNVCYSLDGLENVTISGNLTLTDLLNGKHNVTVYATDLAGNVGSSETLTFTVDKPEPFPIIPVTASIGIVAIVSVSLLIYFKKHKHRVEKT